MADFKSRFQPEHFPEGTVFRVDPSILDPLRDEPPRMNLFPTRRVVRNGFRSYVVETYTTNPTTKGFQTFNLCWVQEIALRGNGPLVIDHSYFGSRMPATLERPEGDERLSWTVLGWGKGYHKGLDIQSLVQPIVARLAPPGLCIDWKKLEEALWSEEWVRVEKDGRAHLIFINRKRLKPWLKRNLNRFATNLHRAEREEEAFMDAETIFDGFEAERSSPTKKVDMDESYAEDDDRDYEAEFGKENEYSAENEDLRITPAEFLSNFGKDQQSDLIGLLVRLSLLEYLEVRNEGFGNHSGLCSLWRRDALKPPPETKMAEFWDSVCSLTNNRG